MSDHALAQLQDVGKEYVKYEDVPTLISGLRHLLKRGKRGRLWAVRHVDLEVGRGESIGIIGRNGSGKSTTLSMLAGVTAPSEGLVRVRGRIAPLLRLGVGFEQELTGRENVFINGMILGMSQKQIEGKFDEIVAFSEIESFIDTPVKFYSSGMLVRLGFASAIAADPDLLIVDEVLAVGDVAFQMRSFDRMLELRENGATLVVVSHNMAAVRRLTDRCIVLHDGQTRFHGPTTEAISIYHDLLRVSVTDEGEGESSSAVKVLSFDMFDSDNNPTANVETDDVVTFRMHVKFEQTVPDAVFGLSIATDAGQFVYGENSMSSGLKTFQAGEERTFSMTVPMRLVSGSYNATCGVRWGGIVKTQVNGPPKIFYVSGRPLTRGIVDLKSTFEVD